MSNKKYNEFTAGTPAGTDIILYGDPSTGALKKVSVNTSGLIKRVKITKTFADFSAAATSGNFIIWTRPANAVVHVVIPIVRELFGITDQYQMDIGIDDDTSFYFGGMNMATDLIPAESDVAVLIEPGFETAGAVKAFINAIGNLDVITTGIVDIYIDYSILE